MAEKTGYEIAVERIEEVARTGATELDLSGLGLESLPPEIGRLNNLTKLNLRDNQLNSLPSEIWQFTNLKELVLAKNKLQGLPSEIGKLSKLTDFYINENQISDLPSEIGQLVNLTSLNLGGNQLTFLPEEISQLIKLTSLYLRENNLSNLPLEIGKLTKLKVLFLYKNNLTQLPPSIKKLKSLAELDLHHNPLAIPAEILNKVNDAQAILSYWHGRRKPLAETKMLVVGQGSVGKTSLVRQIIGETFNPTETKTEGIAINRWRVKNTETDEDQPKELNVNIWDFGGQEIMHATHQFFLTHRSLYLLVLDARIQEENRVEYWLRIIQSFGGRSPVLIVGNKTDQHPLDIDRTGLQKKFPNIVDILETSAATGAGLEELKAAIAEQVNKLPHVRDAIPETWFNIKKQLENLRREQNYISQERYEEKCREFEVRDELSQRTLIGFLHDLGVVLHFQEDPRLESLGILNPQWVTNGVYKILNAHDLFQNKGVLDLSMLSRLLDPSDYPSHNRLFIVDMMKKFELCFDVETDKVFLVPDLLPKEEPSTSGWDDALAFQYLYSVLPSSVMTRFTVRMNRQIAEKLAWRGGVVLELEDNRVLVKADSEERRLSILVNGAKHTRRDALAAVRQQLDDIHSSIKGLMPKRKIPIPGHPNVEPLDYEYLLQLERKGFNEFPVKDGDDLISVDVKKLLNGLESEEVRSTIIIGGNVENSKIVLGNANVLNL